MTDTNQPVLRRVTGNIYLLWLILAIPAIWMVFNAAVFRTRLPYLEWTGLLSCWLLIAALSITPLQLLFGPIPWLRVRRRYLGVASFGYGLLHVVVWVARAKPGALLQSFTRDDVLPGWIAIALMLPLALTSFDWAVRKMGPRWKKLQRSVYPAAALTLLHWVLTVEDRQMIFVYTGPLIALTIWRLWRYWRRTRRV